MPLTVNNRSDEANMKKILKKLSEKKTMDEMWQSLQSHEDYKPLENHIKSRLEEIIEPGSTKSFEEIFIELGHPNSEVTGDEDDLENLIKRVVDKEISTGFLSDEKKERFFKKWDDIVQRN